MKPNLLRGALILFVFGAILAPMGDLCHYLSGTLAYPPATPRIPLTGLPWWDPLLFGTAVLAMGLPDLLGLLPESDGPATGSWRGVVIATLAFLGLYAISGYLPLKTGTTRDAVLAALAWLIWCFGDQTLLTFGLGIQMAVIGSFVEIFLVSHGVFYYIAPNLHGIASWIPWLYFASIVPVRALALRLRNESIARSLQTP